MAISSQHHSFDISLASQYGIEEAILIHHFQHWIRVNRKLNRNLHENRTWTYQTYGEIAAHMPYLSYDKVRHAIKSLITKGVLKKGNFNKRKGDQTVWIAFCDEQEFIRQFPDKTGPLSQEMGNLPGGWRKSQGGGENPTALPDTKTDTKTDSSKEREKVTASPTRAEHVKTSDEEHKKLVSDHGEEKTKLFYQMLSEWKKDTPQSKWKKNDYRSILRWVIKAEEEKNQGNTQWKKKNYPSRSDTYRSTSSERDSSEPLVRTSNSLADILNGASPG